MTQPIPPPAGGDPLGREHDNQALRDERFRLLVQGVTDYAIFMLDPDGRVVCWNTGAERVFGYADAEVIGQHYALFFTPEDVAAGEPDRELRTAAAGRFEAECWRVRRGGPRFLANVVIAAIREAGSGKLLGYSQITRDVTDRRRLEEQLRQAQKMEAVGQLAAGVAHDFNNLLTVINGYGDVLLGTLHPHDQALASVRHVVHAGGRAAAITRQLLAFSRKQVLAPKVVDPNALISEFDPLLRRLVGEGVEVVLNLAENLRAIAVDPVQLEQVFINLAVNARDAMPDGGRLTVRTGNLTAGGPDAPAHPDLPPGPYVALSMSDTGAGMDEATRLRVFEPFFTTKPAGRGTGLGLATVYGVVKQSGGHVEVDSRPGAGATFTVYLPAADGPRREEVLHPFSADVAGGRETILLVEDEESVRSLGRYVLEKGGYTVLTAGDGQVALEVAAAHPGPVHLLVTDVVMPGMGGLQLANRLLVLRPGLRVLYVSGHSEDAVEGRGAFGMPVAFLQKPFNPRDLARKVRETLDE